MMRHSRDTSRWRFPLALCETGGIPLMVEKSSWFVGDLLMSVRDPESDESGVRTHDLEFVQWSQWYRLDFSFFQRIKANAAKVWVASVCCWALVVAIICATSSISLLAYIIKRCWSIVSHEPYWLVAWLSEGSAGWPFTLDIDIWYFSIGFLAEKHLFFSFVLVKWLFHYCCPPPLENILPTPLVGWVALQTTYRPQWVVRDCFQAKHAAFRVSQIFTSLSFLLAGPLCVTNAFAFFENRKTPGTCRLRAGPQQPVRGQDERSRARLRSRAAMRNGRRWRLHQVVPAVRTPVDVREDVTGSDDDDRYGCYRIVAHRRDAVAGVEPRWASRCSCRPTQVPGAFPQCLFFQRTWRYSSDADVPVFVNFWSCLKPEPASTSRT